MGERKRVEPKRIEPNFDIQDDGPVFYDAADPPPEPKVLRTNRQLIDTMMHRAAQLLQSMYDALHLREGKPKFCPTLEMRLPVPGIPDVMMTVEVADQQAVVTVKQHGYIRPIYHDVLKPDPDAEWEFRSDIVDAMMNGIRETYQQDLQRPD